jgi:hypothetical protein
MSLGLRGLGGRGLRVKLEQTPVPRNPFTVSDGKSYSGLSFLPATYFSFVSTGTGYTARVCAANAPHNDTWIIEGVNAGLNPGNITFTGNKLCVFNLDQPRSLTEFRINSNTLVGSFPDISQCSSLRVFDISTNNISGPIPSIDRCVLLQYFTVSTNATLDGAFPSLTYNTALLSVSALSCAFTGSLPSLVTNTLIQTVSLSLNTFSGAIPAFGANTALTIYYCQGNTGLNGDIPTLSGCTTLATMYCYDNAITGVAAGFAIPATLHNFQAQNNLLSQAAVDAILAAFVLAGASGAYTLNIGGTGNAVPSLAGAADKSTLQGRGWTVTTN